MPSTIIPTGPPTHPALHVRDAKDAHVVLEAVRLNMLPLIRRRLTTDERERVVSGNVFVWEEAESEGGLLRWTDGRRWSQSRMRGDYLFYEEKMEATQEEKDAKAALRARRVADPLTVVAPANRRRDRPNRPNGLTKQTYSALVCLPGSSHPRKWHVVAYFSGEDYLRLPVVENYDYLRSLRVPDGIFVSSKSNGIRNDRYPMAESPREGYSPLADAAPSCRPMSHDGPSRPMSSVSPAPSSPHSTASHRPVCPPVSQSTVPRPRHSDGTPLPSISALTTSLHLHPNVPPSTLHAPHPSHPHPVRLGYPSPSNYRPLSAEDRRALSSFRVVL